MISVLLLSACVALSPTQIPPTVTPPHTVTPTLAPTATTGTSTSRPSTVPGWRLEGEPRRYDRETLFDLVNGAADLYFSYGFQDVVVESYVNDTGQAARVEIYATNSDADAYGLFTYHSYGDPVELGVDGEREPGYRLAFWQSRTFVQIVTRETVDDDTLWALGRAVVASLPPGGTRPALVDAMPTQGRQTGSLRFFREKLALDNLLWLGTEDPLGLGPDIAGLVARYEIEGASGDLLLVAYPDPERAEQAMVALAIGEVEGLIAASIQERVVGAVFGALPAESAEALLAEALGAIP